MPAIAPGHFAASTLDHQSTMVTKLDVCYGLLPAALRRQREHVPINAAWVQHPFTGTKVILRTTKGLFYTRFDSIDAALAFLGSSIPVVRAEQSVFVNLNAIHDLDKSGRKHRLGFTVAHGAGTRSTEWIWMSRGCAPVVRRWLGDHPRQRNGGPRKRRKP